MALYDPTLDEVLWRGVPIMYKEGKTTLTVQIASYNHNLPKIYVREEGSHMGWQQDENGKNLFKEPKQLRIWGRPYLRRMELDVIQQLLPDLTVGVEELTKLTEEYKREKETQ
jgi:hypothetical protein